MQVEIPTQPKVAPKLMQPPPPMPPPAPQTEVKKGRGRPRKVDANGNAADEKLLPRPPRFQFTNFFDFLKYWHDIPTQYLNRVTISVYRHWPVIDLKRFDPKAATSIHVYAGEDILKDECPYKDPRNWEDEVLHAFGSGDYMYWLNEMGNTVCKGIAKPRRDMDNYPPLVDLAYLVEEDPQNTPYLDHLKKRGLYSQTDKGKKEEDMAATEAIKDAVQGMSDMANLAVQASQRANIPVPQTNNDRVITELVKPMMSMMEKANESAIATVKAQSSSNDPLATLSTVGALLKDLRGGDGGNSGITIMLEATMKQNSMLLEKLFMKDPPQPQKSGADQLRETLELIKLTREASGRDEDEENPRGKNETAGEVLINFSLCFVDIVGVDDL